MSEHLVPCAIRGCPLRLRVAAGLLVGEPWRCREHEQDERLGYAFGGQLGYVSGTPTP